MSPFGSINWALDADPSRRVDWVRLGDIDMVVHVADSMPFGVGWLNARLKHALAAIAKDFGLEAKLQQDNVLLHERIAGGDRWVEVNIDLARMESLEDNSIPFGAFNPLATYLAEPDAVTSLLVILSKIRSSIRKHRHNPTLEAHFQNVLSDALHHAGENFDKTMKRLEVLHRLAEEAEVPFNDIFETQKADYQIRLHLALASLTLRKIKAIRILAQRVIPSTPAGNLKKVLGIAFAALGSSLTLGLLDGSVHGPTQMGVVTGLWLGHGLMFQWAAIILSGLLAAALHPTIQIRNPFPTLRAA